MKSVREKDFCARPIIFANFGAKKCCNFQSNDTNFVFELILNKDNVLSSSGSDLTSINFKVTYKLSSRVTPCWVSMGTLFETLGASRGYSIYKLNYSKSFQTISLGQNSIETILK